MVATAFEIYKAQADVLVPVVKALASEIGEEHAQRLVRDALGDHFRNFGKTVFAGIGEDEGEHFGKRVRSLIDMFAEGDALDYEVDEMTEERLRFRVTRCQYAELYKALGAPELGFMFVCYQDYPFTEGMDEKAVLDRPQTIMQGAPHCQFNWHVAKDAEDAVAEQEGKE